MTKDVSLLLVYVTVRFQAVQEPVHISRIELKLDCRRSSG